METRELKYRAWNGKAMFYVDVISFQTDTAWKGYDFHSGDSDERCEFGKNEKGVIMQWTGLKDKLGNDIYEGDIVRVSKYDSQCTSLVYWDKDYAKFHFQGPHSYFWETDGLYNPWHFVEVIGNVMQHPELLDNK